MKTFVYLCLLDILTTYIGGIQNEANPIGLIVASRWGIVGLATVKLVYIAQYIVSVTLLRRMHRLMERYYQWAVQGAYTILICWNIFCICRNWRI